MKRIWKMLIVVLAVAMVLSGCVMRTVDELYCLPKRPQADSDLQTVIDQAMVGLSYCAPVYGDNRQVVQPADLDGDGINEYVVLARASGQYSIKILIFRQLAVGYVLAETIDGYGSTFDFIEFANLDDHPGLEIVVGRQVADGVVRSAAVYRFAEGQSQQLLEVSYSQFLTYDMDRDGRSELMLVAPGDSGNISSSVLLYRYEDGALSRISQLDILNPVGTIKRMEPIVLQDGNTAVLVTSNENNIQTMEIFTVHSGQLKHVYGPATVEKCNDHFVYPTDADCDGDTELPELVPILGADGNETGESWILWFGVNSDGQRTEGMYTYYSYADKWYLHMDQNWIKKLTVTRSEGICSFSNLNKETVMTIYALSGANRKEQAQQLGGVVLGSSESVTFAAVLGPGAKELGITEQQLKQLFYPIELELYTEED